MHFPVLEPITKGLLLALCSVVFASVGGSFFLGAIPPASPGLLESLATIGAIFVPAYVVEIAWIVPHLGRGEEFEEWLGFVVGAGIAGLLAIAVALLGVEHRAAGHANSLDDLGLSFVVVSLTILAGTLVLQPLLAHRFRDRESD
jgi:hypothetical protein